MYTLLLRLTGPMQSWGSDSKFEIRRSELFPTKSGITGLLASALGRKRDEDIEDLAKLTIAVRADQPGRLIRDFHTARHKDGKTSYVTNRYYLSDAVFLAGIESENLEQLQTIQKALKNPAYPLFLGRRSCPPTLPIDLGIKEGTALENLAKYPWIGSSNLRIKPDKLRIVYEDDNNEGNRLRDYPISFSPLRRQFGYRTYHEKYIDRMDPSETEHDPFQEL